jgi:hypothetical protein
VFPLFDQPWETQNALNRADQENVRNVA